MKKTARIISAAVISVAVLCSGCFTFYARKESGEDFGGNSVYAPEDESGYMAHDIPETADTGQSSLSDGDAVTMSDQTSSEEIIPQPPEVREEKVTVKYVRAIQGTYVRKKDSADSEKLLLFKKRHGIGIRIGKQEPVSGQIRRQQDRLGGKKLL